MYKSNSSQRDDFYAGDLGTDDEGETSYYSRPTTQSSQSSSASSDQSSQKPSSADEDSNSSIRNFLQKLFGKPDPVNGGLFEAPETLLLPGEYETEENAWFADAFRTYTSMPWKVQLLIMCLFAFNMLLGLGIEYVTSHFIVHHDPINKLALRGGIQGGNSPAVTAAISRRGLLSHTTSGLSEDGAPPDATFWDYPYAYLMRHQYILHAFTSLIPHCLSWILVCPLVAVYFLYRQSPQYFASEFGTHASDSAASSSSSTEDDDGGLFPASPTASVSDTKPFFDGAAGTSGILGCVFSGSAKPFGDAYMYAFRLLWLRSIHVFFWYTAPTLGLRMLFIVAVGTFAQRSLFLFMILFLHFLGAAIYVMIMLTFAMPIFVDHPGFSPPVVLRVSADLVRRNLLGITRFNAYVVLLSLFGTLLFVVGYFAAAPICLFALAAAYRSIVGVYTWGGQGSQVGATSSSSNDDDGECVGYPTSGTSSYSSASSRVPSFLEDEDTIV